MPTLPSISLVIAQMWLPRNDNMLLWVCGWRQKGADAEKTFSPEKNNRNQKKKKNPVRYVNSREQELEGNLWITTQIACETYLGCECCVAEAFFALASDMEQLTLFFSRWINQRGDVTE